MFLTSGTIPIDTPEHFVEWFKWTREQSKIQQDSDSILRVQFEDMIYEYERTRTKIVEFCGLGNLLCQKKKQFSSLMFQLIILRYGIGIRI